MSLRSHHGCARCKRRRQKCDEGKPSCRRCVEAEASCEYLLTLKWDGRVPRRQGGSRRKEKQRPLSDTPANSETAPPRDSSLELALIDLPQSPESEATFSIRELDMFSPWTPAEKLLWEHFVNDASMVASHSQLRDQICHQILPMATQIPSLMYGTLALSALHRLTLLNGLPDEFIPEAMVSNLMSRSLKHLRNELQANDPRSRHLALHTIRTICVAEIYSGKADSSWRVHVDGAKAILDAMKSTVDRSDSEQTSWLTSRWYSSIEALTALTNRGITSADENQGETLGDDSVFVLPEDDILDIYTGYSSDLNAVFREIGSLARKRSQSGDDSTAEELQIQTLRLEQVVQEMIRRDHEEGLKMPADIRLSRDEVRQFNACNAAYQHSALLHIYRRLQRKRTDSAAVQASVKSILRVLCGILPMVALSPWALLTTPLFTAG